MPKSSPDIDATRLHWDDQAEGYDAAKQRNHAYFGTLKECFSHAIPPEMRGRVLDVGCGTGQIIASLNPREGVGVDLSPRMVGIARRQYGGRPNLNFENLSATQVGLADRGSFDAVISGDMIEHADDWRAAVAAMVSVCRPGGLIVVSTPNPAWTMPLWILEKLKLKLPEGPHRFVWATEVARHFRSLGCTVTACQTHLLLPIGLAGFGPAASRVAQCLPLTDRLGVIQIVAARRNS